MPRVKTPPADESSPEVDPIDQVELKTLEKYGTALLKGDDAAARKLAAELAFPPAVVQLHRVMAAELNELKAALGGLPELEARVAELEKLESRLQRARPSSLQEAETIEARLAEIRAELAEKRGRLNDAKRARVLLFSIVNFGGRMFGFDRTAGRGGHAICDGLCADTKTLEPARAAGCEEVGFEGWRSMLSRPRPKIRKWLNSLFGGS